ncbi:hypothetical protein D9M72_531950 [compost metagenome]
MNAAHSISASTMSSSPTGAFMIPSQVFCTCIRENAEYSASKLAAFIALMQIDPLARNRMYGTCVPSTVTCPTKAPIP